MIGGKAPAAHRFAAVEGVGPSIAAAGSSATRRSRIRIGVAVLTAVLLIAGGGAAASVAATQSAWTDATYATASIASGSWSALGGCTAMSSTNVAVGTCAIAAMTYTGAGAANKHVRTFSVTFAVTSTSAAYVVFQADLSKATVVTDTSVGAWSWPTALTLASTQMTPSSACTALPVLNGRAVSNGGWLTSPTITFQVVDSRSAVGGQTVSCS